MSRRLGRAPNKLEGRGYWRVPRRRRGDRADARELRRLPDEAMPQPGHARLKISLHEVDCNANFTGRHPPGRSRKRTPLPQRTEGDIRTITTSIEIRPVRVPRHELRPPRPRRRHDDPCRTADTPLDERIGATESARHDRSASGTTADNSGGWSRRAHTGRPACRRRPRRTPVVYTAALPTDHGLAECGSSMRRSSVSAAASRGTPSDPTDKTHGPTHGRSWPTQHDSDQRRPSTEPLSATALPACRAAPDQGQPAALGGDLDRPVGADPYRVATTASTT